ncbi:BadF/BadG/BcrA/BcrD ATPase family protein [Thalassobacillus sp. CUG 92003]|uniref:N-acetylglucosamine kinase n=1 Tax=Thalassobacillus sp. CUG 92003 TaxID=2736641 RepID=UPI0015E6823F
MPSNNGFYIGVDGGGTKTAALLCDETGRVIGASQSGSTSFKSRTESDIYANFQRLTTELMTDAELLADQVTGVFVSAAGGDRQEDKQRWSKMLTSVFSNLESIEVKNDAFGALASGTFDIAGSVLIAGTGSIAYSTEGLNSNAVRVGGWGYLFGDEGSGYDMGRQALSTLALMEDERVPFDSGFSEMVLNSLQVKKPENVITAVYESDYPRHTIASLARPVLDLAADRNTTARMIMNQTLRNLLDLVEAIALKRPASRAEPITIVGGLFQSDLFRLAFMKLMHKRQPSRKVIYPKLPPVAGSLICALIQNGVPITADLKANLHATYKKRG